MVLPSAKKGRAMMEPTFQDTIARLKSIREYSARLLYSRDSSFMCPCDIRMLDSIIGDLEALEHRSLCERKLLQLINFVLRFF